MTGNIYDRVECFLDFIESDRQGIRVQRELHTDNHICRLELKSDEYSSYDLQELQDKVCRYVISHKYSIMIDHIEYRDGIIMVDIFDAEGAHVIFGVNEDG